MVEPPSGTLRSELELAAIRKRYEGMLAPLDRDQRTALRVVAIEQRLPRWWYMARARREPSPLDEREREALLRGLKAPAKG